MIQVNQFTKNEYLSVNLFKWRHAFLWLLIKWHREFRANGLRDIPEVMEATQQYQSSQDPVKTWLNDNLEVTGDMDDYISVKWLKEKLLDASLYRNKFKRDCDLVEYLIKLYPRCEYAKNRVRIKKYDVRNILRGVTSVESFDNDQLNEELI